MAFPLIFKNISQRKAGLYEFDKKEFNEAISSIGGGVFFIFTLAYSILGIYHGLLFDPNFIKIWMPNLLGLSLCILAFVANHKGKTKFSTYLILIFPPLLLLFSSMVLWGDSTGSYYYIFFCSVLGIFLIPRIRYKFINLVFNLICFLLCIISFKVGWFKAFWYVDHLNIVNISYFLNMLSIFLLLFFIIYYGKFQTTIAVEEIHFKKKEVLNQNEKIKAQNIAIKSQGEKLADSIRFAYDFQKVLLPTEKTLKLLFKDIFILFKPLDIVSGDFYWAKELGRFKIIVAADCTGHGVSGAFMSIMGISFLDKIISVYEEKFTKKSDYTLLPHEILNQLQTEVYTVLSQQDEAQKIQFGMEIAICVLEENEMLNEKIVHFSGANCNMFCFQNQVFNEIKGNKNPIGYYNHSFNFTTHSLFLSKNDIFYLFSDGYKDQFGFYSNTYEAPKEMRLLSKRFKIIIDQIHLLDISDQKIALENHLEEWQQHCDQTDDILIIGIKV